MDQNQTNQEISLQNLSQQISELQNQLSDLSKEKNNPTVTKALGKYHDIYLLILGFTLTAMAGGFISYIYQKKMYDYQKKAINYENKQIELSAFYKRISEIITIRYLNARRLHNCIDEQENNSEINAQKEKYYLSVDEWSRNDAYNRAFIQNSFNDSSVLVNYFAVASNFTQRIHPLLRQLLKKHSDRPKLDSLTYFIRKQDSLNKEFFIVCSRYIFPKKID